MALPRRRSLSLHLRRRAGALLLTAARLSRSAVGDLHARRYAPRIPDGERMRAALHGFVRASGVNLRRLARAPAPCTSASRAERVFTRHGTHPDRALEPAPQESYFFGCALGGKIPFSLKYTAASA